MKICCKFFPFILFCILNCSIIDSAAQITDNRSLIQKAEKLAKDYPSLCTSRKIDVTPSGNDLIIITIGTDAKDDRPGIAICGGIDGTMPFTRHLALGFAENILRESSKDEIMDLLKKVTFYVFPDVNPDASAQYFSKLKYERTVNGNKTDSDRDFLTDEDPFEDLNGDGLITQIRITDPTGKFIESPDDSRVLIEADLSKGQTGKYMVYTEGTNNDDDELFNEDGPGGVDFNRNFTYNYEEYGKDAGLHAVSEPESKAVADFLYDHFNIFAVICFGPQHNLTPANSGGGERPAQGFARQSQQETSEAGRQIATGDRRITSVLRSDETVIRLVSEKFQEITGLKGSPPVKTTPGNFADWVYYHYGRYSFSTPGWWFPSERGKNTEVSFLKYADENKLSDVFVPWIEIKHPDFQGKKVEVGGIKPFAMTVPPSTVAEEFITKNYRFIIAVAGMHPELEFTDTRIETPGNDIFRVSLKVHNKGLFATCAEVGNNNIWTRIMRISLESSKGQVLLSGQKVQRIHRLEGNGTVEFSWLISGKGKINITAGALNTGTITTTLDLK